MRRAGAAALLLLLAGCSWSNSMYMARRYSRDALRTEREGRPFEAQTLWGQVIGKADSAWARSKQRNHEALALLGIARARTNDCTGAIPSLAGEGIGIAIASGVRAAHVWLKGGAPAAATYQRRLASDLARPMAVAGLVRRSVESTRLAPPLLRIPGASPRLIQVIARLTRIGHSPIDCG